MSHTADTIRSTASCTGGKLQSVLHFTCTGSLRSLKSVDYLWSFRLAWQHGLASAMPMPTSSVYRSIFEPMSCTFYCKYCKLYVKNMTLYRNHHWLSLDEPTDHPNRHGHNSFSSSITIVFGWNTRGLFCTSAFFSWYLKSGLHSEHFKCLRVMECTVKRM